ncbi:hypothetical protein ANAPRD1_00568 [Anaplasma phagocytophilum]|nr:hypothetical protein ANAPRD1_00568 [Anaplasma phagocytophilum]
MIKGFGVLYMCISKCAILFTIVCFCLFIVYYGMLGILKMRVLCFGYLGSGAS